MKKINFLLITCALSLVTSAQTLFTYGKHSVDASEFLRAYNKNNTQVKVEKAKAIREYLDLFINSKLKIREAYDRKYDTLPQVRMEVENLRRQIAENYMNDPLIRERLQTEAFNRSQKDIRVAHIFISLKKGDEVDSSGALKKKNEVINRLSKGEDFSKLAKEVSDDPVAKTNGGEIGYITVFTLPYEFENAIYSTPAGKYSSPVQSKAGYHIFKNLGERKSAGKIKVQQILIAIPPGADETAKKDLSRRADSLYDAIRKGSSFDELAGRFSNDYVSAANKGIMPEFGVGEYDPVFENAVWALAKDGDMTKPFVTAHGYHIVKRISFTPTITDPKNTANNQELLSKLMKDSRWKASRDFMHKKVLEKPGLKKMPYTDEALWALADSILDLKPLKDVGKSINQNTAIFKIGDSSYTAGQFLNYARFYRLNQQGGGMKPLSQVRDEYIQTSLYNFYQNNLELYNKDFANQMAEFRDGNIFFEIMQQEVWNKAQTDSTALKALYEKNKNNYMWKQSADAIVFFAGDEANAKFIYDELKKDPASFRRITEQYAEKVVIDSARFEWDQLPLDAGVKPTAGMLSKPVVNPNDNSVSFTYILRVYTEPSPRSFAEAKGLVINDYQDQLEKNWIAALKKKYPVTINQKVLEQISK